MWRSGHMPLTSTDGERNQADREEATFFSSPLKCWQYWYTAITIDHKWTPLTLCGWQTKDSLFSARYLALQRGQKNKKPHHILRKPQQSRICQTGDVPRWRLAVCLFTDTTVVCRAVWWGSPAAVVWQQINTTSSVVIITPSAAEAT